MEQNQPHILAEPDRQLLEALDSGFAQRVVQVGADGERVAYRSGGSTGPAVVLLHGISSGAASWLPCASLLAAHARVIAWDAPGYGDSSPLPQARPLASDYAQRLDRLLQALGVQPALIVGHSLGALMAAAYVANARQLPARLLLLSVAQGYGGAGREAQAREVARQRLEALESLGVDGLAQRGPARLLSEEADPGAQAWVRWNMQRLNPDGYRQAVAMLCGDDIHAYLARRPDALPTQIACGSRDVVTTPPACGTLAERFGLPFSLIPDAGHACYIDQAAATARLIRSVLDDAT
ncbi:2-succinyl-6-hydroxy-2,4-cyclohexadiene-1-carboxylate synthase MenH [Cupriavidus necator]|uniref:Alpha/beta hydrolase n=1 Tax=Cupriavidus necator (strain ATCC 17699 / DSM 428 / KCTC 22496 / NCIMB 10442 / H16 / Stanier 337) TaxID=381666 RepID=Q0K399_CUPNH|nr:MULTISPECIES: alpha/beta hydrolase [Cupriavidus]EON19077.1 alpha/beta superfamily hydrolase/acyltransferase [Cupriavidus sp. GA3-3]KUE87514.1 alpha/beta hydrolase [Cupriavidus necator]QCC03426.1 alpha/beta hydrolase [Cupriavidus necator H16]QQB80482.1 alpha/beta hydrolase [Cupriavidus necator]WKA44764.1 alpha/beta hydrolase [Cupriavidus necator]